MEAIPPLWTVDDVAKFLRIEHLPRARVLQRLADLRRDRGFPRPLIQGKRGDFSRYDPAAILAWLRRERGEITEVVVEPRPVVLSLPDTGFNIGAFDD